MARQEVTDCFFAIYELSSNDTATAGVCCTATAGVCYTATAGVWYCTGGCARTGACCAMSSV